jgi:hypothetical protein
MTRVTPYRPAGLGAGGRESTAARAELPMPCRVFCYSRPAVLLPARRGTLPAWQGVLPARQGTTPVGTWRLPACWARSGAPDSPPEWGVVAVW